MHNLLHVSVFLECHHQGVPVSLKVLSFELVCDVSHNHSQAHKLKLDLNPKKCHITKCVLVSDCIILRTSSKDTTLRDMAPG
jgi:hypothetical protein